MSLGLSTSVPISGLKSQIICKITIKKNSRAEILVVPITYIIFSWCVMKNPKLEKKVYIALANKISISIYHQLGS